ncbi:MAG: carboxymuconolactone decarboxylase family protein [Candidatus Rokubacteria bacterium]|nr:carboxymuconolactone decarboxylase family protein [Candidatus Rokubacteria bacterium]
MAWVRTVDEPEVEGYVKTLYEGMLKQRGWVPNIVKSTTLRPELTRAWMGLFTTLMFGPSELTRAQREMIATVVSVANRCHY